MISRLLLAVALGAAAACGPAVVEPKAEPTEIGHMEPPVRAPAPAPTATPAPTWDALSPGYRDPWATQRVPFSLATPADLYCTGSMAPTLECGPSLWEVDPGAGPLPVGTIIGYHCQELSPLYPDLNPAEVYAPGLAMLVVHRIVERTYTAGELRYRVKGDANPVADPCLPAHGEVLAVIAAQGDVLR